jgi:hypothetical protein
VQRPLSDLKWEFGSVRREPSPAGVEVVLSRDKNKIKSEATGEGARPTLRGAINSQYFYQICHFTQMTKRIPCRFFISAEEIGVEHIFPRSAA